ncbi:hypothetical protein NM208_g996 [Fusarium decemcellulare]|uniref:Uncharacterized protein n=1 Tax=Fusarium decemcellulare TaxID=57161 RepID=A0ACC1SXS8_9HYPO|nr:hypothetical protein NM208_g996 [Fusarium decemcellulare]
MSHQDDDPIPNDVQNQLPTRIEENDILNTHSSRGLVFWAQALAERHQELVRVGVPNIMRIHDFKAVQSGIEGLQCERKRARAARVLESLDAVIERLRKFVFAVSVFVQSDPAYSSLIWGGLLCFSQSSRALKAIKEHFERMTRAMPRFEEYTQLYSTHERLGDSLLQIYRHYLDACIHAVKFLRQRPWWSPIALVMSSVVQRFDDARKSIAESTREFEDEARLAHDMEAAIHRRDAQTRWEILERHQSRMEGALPTILARPQRESLFSVPFPRNHRFLGRESELHQLKTILIDETQSQKTCVVYGIGGVGKTNLALETCYQFKEHFRFIFWVAAENEAALSTSFAKLAEELSIRPPEPGPSPLATDTMRRWLYPGWLLVFDNADSDQSSLNKFWPPCDNGSILVTSQNSHWADRTHSVFKVEPLDEDSGSQLLLQHYHNASGKPDLELEKLAKNISKEVDGLPLLLVSLGGSLSQNHLSLEETLEVFKKSPAPLRHILADNSPSWYERPAQLVFQLAFSQLPEAAREVISVMAMLSPNNIPESLIIAKPRQDDIDYDFNPVWYAIPSSFDQENLVNILNEGTERAYSMHRSVQRFVIEELGDEEKQHAFDEGVKLLCSRLPKPSSIMVPHLTKFDLLAQYMPHVLSIHSVYVRYRSYLSPTVAFAEMICSATAYLYETGLAESCLDVATTGETVCEELDKSLEAEDDPCEFESMRVTRVVFEGAYEPVTYNLGTLAGNISAYGAGVIWCTGGLLNRQQGHDMTYKVLKLREGYIQTSTQDQHRLVYENLLSNGLNDWALQLINEGRYSEAKGFSERSLDMKCRLLGEDKDQFQFFISKILLAVVALSEGNAREATAIAEDAIEHVEREKGHNDPFTNHYMFHVANIWSAVGEHVKALGLLKASLKARLQLFGETNHDTLNGQFAVSLCLYRLGIYDEASEYMEKCLKRANAARWGQEHVLRAQYTQSLIMQHVEAPEHKYWEMKGKEALRQRDQMLRQCAKGKWAEPTSDVDDMVNEIQMSTGLLASLSEYLGVLLGRQTAVARRPETGFPPELDPDNLILREASEEEKVQCWRNNSEAWKGKLTVEQYIEQQRINGRQALTRNGRIRYWVLTNGKEIYTSAETLQKPAVMCGQNGEKGTRFTYGIAGVFTPVRFRRHGCASSLMRKLVEWLDSDDVVCDFTVLWSAVGNFYERFGWMVLDTKEALIPAGPLLDANNTAPLFCDQIKELCDRDVEAIIHECCPILGKEARIACLPTYEQAEWYFASEDYIASQLVKTLPPPYATPGLTQVKGAISHERDVCCYWLHDFNAEKLIILRLSFKKPGGKLTDAA